VVRAVVEQGVGNKMRDVDGYEEMYTWRVGGPNDIKCTHLRDVYRGETPLESTPSPFCTKSSCPMPSVGPRTAVNLGKVFISDDDRVLLKSMAFG
jgi:6-phosphofructokinase 1